MFGFNRSVSKTIRALSCLRTCIICGSIGVKGQTLCGFCSKVLLPIDTDLKYQKIDCDSRRLNCAYLFDWIPDKSWATSQLVSSLKRNPNSEDFSFLAAAVARSCLRQGRILNAPIFIPAPSKNGSADHASSFAEAVSLALGGRFVNCLGRQGDRSQKELSRAQRRGIRLKSSENFSKVSSSIIFIDDVITTGATVHSAYIALGRPRAFLALAIAYRQRPGGCDLDVALL